MAEEDLMEPADAVVVLAEAGVPAAEEGPPDTLSLRLLAAETAEAPPLMLHGFYNIGVERAGRFGGELPAAIQAVLVVRETGAVLDTPLLNDGDIPAAWIPDAPPTIEAEGVTGMSQLGHFTADLAQMVNLPESAFTVDAFLWLEDLVSEVASARKRTENPDLVLPRAGGLRPEGAEVAEGPVPEAPTLALEGGRLAGAAPGDRVSVIALSYPDQRIAYTVLTRKDAEGIAFSLPLDGLVPDLASGARVMAVAIAAGARSALVDASAP